MNRSWAVGTLLVTLAAWGCETEDALVSLPSSEKTECAAAYPEAAENVLSDGEFVGESGAVAFHDFYEPCAERSRLLVVRVAGAFCGPCRWHAAHTAELRRSDIGERLRVVDLLISNEDDEPAEASDLAAWRRAIDAPDALAIDPAFRLRGLLGSAPLPLYVVVDSRSMGIRQVLSDPAPDGLMNALRSELAKLDGVAEPSAEADALVDGRFDRKAWDLIQGMKLVGKPPADPTNAHADDPAAAALGKRFFFDKGMSPSNTVSCATCHDEAKGWSDGLPQSVGVATADRNAPSVLLASHSRWQFWDGRADSLWAQALGPFENKKEFGSSRQFVAQQVHDRYKADYEAVFEALPELSDTEKVTRVFVNVGKAIAAFERTLEAKPTALDRYAAGDFAALDEAQKAGLSVFLKVGCAQCHYGPRLTDDAFHNVHFPGFDAGRVAVERTLNDAEFSAAGRYSDHPREKRPARSSSVGPGAFKTPALRGVAKTAPYGHAGRFSNLNEVLRHYAGESQRPADPSASESALVLVAPFDPGQAQSLVRFLTIE